MEQKVKTDDEGLQVGLSISHVATHEPIRGLHTSTLLDYF